MMNKMKLFKATIVANNSCYLHTLLIVAENEATAHEMLCENQDNKFIKYTQKLVELDIDMTKPQVLEYVGWGHSESDYDSGD